MLAIMMNDYNMTKFSRFAVKLFFISFEPSASIVFVAAPVHFPSCVSQRSNDWCSWCLSFGGFSISLMDLMRRVRRLRQADW